MVQGTKTREDRLRRMAARQGMRLFKSRDRDPRRVGFGTWSLDLGEKVGGEPPLERWYTGLDLDQVEACLTGQTTEDEIRDWQHRWLQHVIDRYEGRPSAMDRAKFLADIRNMIRDIFQEAVRTIIDPTIREIEATLSNPQGVSDASSVTPA